MPKTPDECYAKGQKDGAKPGVNWDPPVKDLPFAGKNTDSQQARVDAYKGGHEHGRSQRKDK